MKSRRWCSDLWTVRPPARIAEAFQPNDASAASAGYPTIESRNFDSLRRERGYLALRPTPASMRTKSVCIP